MNIFFNSVENNNNNKNKLCRKIFFICIITLYKKIFFYSYIVNLSKVLQNNFRIIIDITSNDYIMNFI